MQPVFILLGLLSQLSSTLPASAGTVFDQAMRKGDGAHAEFDNQGALEQYRKAVELDPSNYEALWKLVRAHINVGQAAEGSTQRDHYTVAEKLARQCVSAYEEFPEGHFFLAVALGRVALKVGGKKKIRLGEEIKSEAERTLEIDPRHDGAMHLLGRWNYERANLSWILRVAARIIYGGVPRGSNEDAKRWFENAIEISPGTPVHHLWLGETLVKLKDYQQARHHFQICLELPKVFWDDPLNKEQAKKRLREIRHK